MKLLNLQEKQNVIDQLRDIVKNKNMKKIKFSKGSLDVDLFSASAILNVYDALKANNQKKYYDLINKDKDSFMKAHAIAFKLLNK